MASATSNASSPVPGSAPRRNSRPRVLALGLLLSLVGLVLVAVLLPTAPGSLSTVLPIAAAGLVLLWVGGILLGRGGRSQD